MKHTSKIQYYQLEDKNIQDLKELVCRIPEIEIMRGIDNKLHLLQLVLQITGILFMIGYHVWWMAFVVLGFSIPIIYLARKGSKEQYQLQRETSEIRRKSEYFSKILTNREGSGERAIFQFTDWLNDKYKENNDEYVNKNKAMRGKWLLRSKACSILYVLIVILIVYILIPVTLDGRMSLGFFLAIITNSISLVQLISWSLFSYIESISKWFEFKKELNQYMNLKEEGKETLIDSNEIKEIKEKLKNEPIKIELKNISFTYPGTDRKILNNISLTLESGKHYAIVGENGAGKTTLMKILTRLYDNYEGELLVNGRDIKTYPSECIPEIYSMIYQDFAKYDMTMKDNIMLGREENKKDMDKVLDVTGVKELSKKHKNGWDTYLGKIEEHGVDLSAGKWQKIALARAFVARSAVHILDEPTSALDPISESRLYRQFQTKLKGMTTLFCSHRLGSTILADTIFVLSAGEIVEVGNHEELQKLNGVYKNMYEAQRRWYD